MPGPCDEKTKKAYYWSAQPSPAQLNTTKQSLDSLVRKRAHVTSWYDRYVLSPRTTGALHMNHRSSKRSRRKRQLHLSARRHGKTSIGHGVRGRSPNRPNRSFQRELPSAAGARSISRATGCQSAVSGATGPCAGHAARCVRLLAIASLRPRTLPRLHERAELNFRRPRCRGADKTRPFRSTGRRLGPTGS